MEKLTGCNRLAVNSDCMEVIDTMIQDEFKLSPATAIYDDYFFSLL